MAKLPPEIDKSLDEYVAVFRYAAKPYEREKETELPIIHGYSYHDMRVGVSALIDYLTNKVGSDDGEA